MPRHSSLQLVEPLPRVGRPRHLPAPRHLFLALIIIGMILIAASVYLLLSGHGAGVVPDTSAYI